MDAILTFTSPKTSAHVANSDVSSLGRAAWQDELSPARAEVSMVNMLTVIDEDGLQSRSWREEKRGERSVVRWSEVKSKSIQSIQSSKVYNAVLHCA